GARTVVAMPGQRVTVRVLSRDDAMLTVDGQVGARLKAFDQVVVERATKPARLVSFGEREFYSLICMRFGLGKDRKSTRLNSSHVKISYAVFCLRTKRNN